MLEAPEARIIARQLEDTIKGKKIICVLAGYPFRSHSNRHPIR